MSCEVEELLESAKCYLDQCLSPADRSAIEIYLLANSLAAAGGESYDPASLQIAAKEWNKLSIRNLSAINTYLDEQDARNSGATIPETINELKSAAACYLCIPEMIRKQLLTFLRCEGAAYYSLAFYTFNGYDPILPGPNPPVNYQLFMQQGQPRGYFTVPDLIINVSVENIPDPDLQVSRIFIQNYDSGDTTASQSGTTVTLVGGAFRFTSTADDAGRKIYWSNLGPNTGEEATVVSVTNPFTAVVVENQTVAAGRFTYLTPGIVFKIWLYDSTTDAWVEMADSDAPNENGFHWELWDLEIDFPDVRMGPTWWQVDNPSLDPVPAYVTAEESGKIVYSPTFLLAPNIGV